MKKPDMSLSTGLYIHLMRLNRRAGFIALAVAVMLSLFLGLGAALAARPDEGAARPAAVAQPDDASLTMTKTMISPVGRTTVYGGEDVTFEVEVKNTGAITVAYLPQADTYFTGCLQFVPKASPPETGHEDSLGIIWWEDLTASNSVDLAPGESFITRLNFRVPVSITGGAQSGYNTASVSGALDADGNPVAPVESTVAFTCAQRPLLDLDKSFSVPRATTVLLTGEQISFTVSLTNTGPTTLAYIPLLDQFDDSCLAFVPKASPPESGVLGNLILWDDLTASYGSDLPPGESFVAMMNFVVTGPPSGVPVLASQNRAQTSGALDINGSPAPDAEDTVLYSCAAPASIGDYVWLDLNGNGAQDEPPGSGLNGVTLYLYLDDGDGEFNPLLDQLVATQVTSGDGGYLFDMLHAGDYWVDVDETTLPAGLTLSAGLDPRPVTVGYGEAYLLADFGYAGADVSIVKTDTFDPVVVGGVLTYTLSINNAGPSAALNVVVSDTLPAGLTFVAAQPPQTSGPNPLTWNLGTLDAGAGRTIVVTTTVTAPAGSILVNQAEVTTDSPDPNPDNDRDTETTLIVRPQIDIEKTPDAQQVTIGGTAIFNIWVKNTGDVPLTNVVVSDPLVPNCDQTFPSLAVNEVQTYTCALTNVSQGFTNVATVTGTPPVGPDVTDSDDALVVAEPPTSVAVFNFGGATAAAGVELRWNAYVPQGSQAPFFHVYRGRQNETTWTKLTGDEPVGPVSPNANFLSYTFTDAGAQRGVTYLYQLVDADDPDQVYGPYEVKAPNEVRRVFLPLLVR